METKDFVITKSDLALFLEELIKKTDVIAPVKNEFEDVFFLPVDSIGEVCFDYENTLNSAKEFFLPDSEYIFTFKGEKDNAVKIPGFGGNFVIFGLRSCDTKALNLLDKFFKRNFEDELYLEKRKSSTLISLACYKSWEECFCESVGSGPVLDDELDIQLIPLNNRFFVQVGTEKGDALLKDFKEFFKPAGDDDNREATEFKNNLKNAKVKFDLEKVYKNLKEGKVNPSLWQDIASRCQSCGLCLFICPTCSCFTVNDRQKATGSQGRIRQWDTCYFRGFTRMAGNQDPIKNQEEMVKRKYVHKIWQQMDEFGMSGCTGCGRCNRACVGNVNWLENLVKIEG